MSRAVLPSLALLTPLLLATLTGCGGTVEIAPATSEDTGAVADAAGTPSDAVPADGPSPTEGDSSTDSTSPIEDGGPADGSRADGGSATRHSVEVSGTSFKPASLTIKTGDTVEWIWKGGMHNVISGPDCSSDGTFASGPPKSTGTYTFTFDTAGTFPYHCIPHCSAGMKGKIVVAP